jgi:hypothetical protein
MHILGKTMASHFFGRGGRRRGGSRGVALVLILQGYTSLMKSLTCLSVIDVKDLLQT